MFCFLLPWIRFPFSAVTVWETNSPGHRGEKFSPALGHATGISSNKNKIPLEFVFAWRALPLKVEVLVLGVGWFHPHGFVLSQPDWQPHCCRKCLLGFLQVALVSMRPWATFPCSWPPWPQVLGWGLGCEILIQTASDWVGKSIHKKIQPWHQQEAVWRSTTWAPILWGQWGHTLELPFSNPRDYRPIWKMKKLSPKVLHLPRKTL